MGRHAISNKRRDKAFNSKENDQEMDRTVAAQSQSEYLCLFFLVFEQMETSRLSREIHVIVYCLIP